MITHRNAYLNSVGTLIHHHMTCADRYAWTLPMFHANGWTSVWTVTAGGGAHLLVRPGEPAKSFGNARPGRRAEAGRAASRRVGSAHTGGGRPGGGPRAGGAFAMGGSIPATRPSCTRTDTSRSAIGSRM